MNLTIVTQEMLRHQVVWMDAMAVGLRKHGVIVTRVSEGEPIYSNIAVCWGWRIGRELRETERHEVLVLERGYLGNRRAYSMCGWNGLNGNADFGAAGNPRDRLDRHFKNILAPWRTTGKHTLIMGQVPGDQSVLGVDLMQWYEDAATSAASMRRPVYFRPHPMSPAPPYPNLPIMAGTLGDALADAAAVVTFNSNSAVDAAIAGVPVYTLDRGSMAWDVAAHSLDDDPIRPDRTQWASDLAYKQWSLQEVTAGDAWAHLKEGIQCH